MTKNDGALVAKIGVLDVTRNDTDFTLDGTLASDVAVNTVKLGNAHELSIILRNNGDMTLNSVNVTGSGNRLNVVTTLPLTIPNVTFDLTGVAAGSTLLSASNVDADGASISLTGMTTLAHGDTVAVLTGASGSADLGNPQRLAAGKSR